MFITHVGVFFAAAAFLVSVPCHARSLAHAGEWDWRDATLLDRRADASCIQFCSPKHCGGGSCPIEEKRDLDEDDEEEEVDFFNSTSLVGSETEPHLFKRQFQVITQGKTAKYVRDRNLDIGTEPLCPDFRDGFGGPSFCTEHAFNTAPLSNGECLIGTRDVKLLGCTVLTVVSAHGVYMCHLWEDNHYSQVPGPNARQYWGFQPVLNLIQGMPWTPAASGNSLTTGLFPRGKRPDGRANTYAFIMTPRSRANLNDETSREYDAEYRMLYALLDRLIPGINIMPISYNPWRRPGEKPYKGRALFEYDPDADGNDNADWRLWLEHRQITGRSLGLDVDNIEV